jgi:hypothetical protein
MFTLEMKRMLLTSVSAGCVISSFRLNLTIQTLIGLLSVGIVPIPPHTQNISGHTFIQNLFKLKYVLTRMLNIGDNQKEEVQNV